MAGNTVYPIWKEQLMKGTAGYDIDNDTTTDGVYAVLIDTGVYTYNDAHAFYTSIASGIVNVEQRIVAPTIGVVAPAVFDGNDLVFLSVTGASVEALALFRKNSGANSTWPLVMYYDTGGTGLPIVPNSGNITLGWNNLGIFKL